MMNTAQPREEFIKSLSRRDSTRTGDSDRALQRVVLASFPGVDCKVVEEENVTYTVLRAQSA